MTLLLIAQTMFGNAFAFRILRRTRDRMVISTQSLTKIGTAFAFVMCLSGIFLLQHARAPLFLVIGALITLQLALKWREKQRLELLAARFPHFLDRWLLNLRMGMASSTARERALSLCESQFRALIAPVFESSMPAVQDQRHPFLTLQQVQELRSAHAQPHSTVARLQSLRLNVTRATSFRRKSGQALRQALVQSLVLLILHISLVAFTFARGVAASNLDLILFSTLLTGLGILILRLLARRIRWTI